MTRCPIYITIFLFHYSINKKKYCISISSNLTVRIERQISKIVKPTHWFAIFGQYRAWICYANRIFDGIQNGNVKKYQRESYGFLRVVYVCENLFALDTKVISPNTSNIVTHYRINNR